MGVIGEGGGRGKVDERGVGEGQGAGKGVEMRGRKCGVWGGMGIGCRGGEGKGGTGRSHRKGWAGAGRVTSGKRGSCYIWYGELLL
jgi:hypothetical protein